MTEEPISFKGAMDELKTLLEQMEKDEADLDTLSERVERAADLIRLCHQRIHRTEMKVQQIIGQLEEDLSISTP